MSMIMQYVRIRDTELTRLKTMLGEDPDGAYEYVDALADGEDGQGGDGGQGGIAERSRSLDTDKTWEAMAFLLDRAGRAPVDVIKGGVALTEDEWGCEPPRYLTPEQVSQAAAHLFATPFYRLAEHFDPAAMTEIYPGVWGDEDALGYLRGWYERLTTFFRHAAAERDAMIVYLI